MRSSRRKTERELRVELERVEARLHELEATQNAIRRGDVDAIVVEGPNGSQVFTLQSPEDPYRILAERMNEGAATLSADGTILFCNRRLAEMVKRPAEQLLGASFFSLLRQDEGNALRHFLESAMKQDVRAEGELLQKNGKLLPVQLSLSLVSFSDLEKVFCLVATDLNELTLAKRGLRQQNEIFELAHDAILIRDLHGRVQSWNRGAKDLYGWPAEEAVGRVISDLLHTQFPEPFGAIEALLLASKEWEGEVTQTRRGGGTVVVASRWSLLRDERGNPTAILEINRDITARKEAEVALQKSEDAYRKLAELVPQLVWKCTPDGLNIYFNRQWVEYTGLTLEESYGEGWNTPFHPDDKTPAWKAWKHAVETGETYRIDCRLRAANGSYRWFLIKGIPLQDDKGSVVEWFGTCTDVDDLKRSEEARCRANEELRELNQELESRVALRTRELADSMKDLESFAYSVSHDLRAPLRHIDGFLTLLSTRTYATLDDSSKHYVDRAILASRRMGQLIDDLLQFSRTGRAQIHKMPVDLNAVVRAVLRELEPESFERKIDWHLTPLPQLAADKAMLLQVIENLVGNALKFTRGRETAKIEIGCKPGLNGESVIFIRDNGAGFDMRYYNKLFQVFQRLHGDHEFEGTGIGLAICRSVVERHGGRIWAEGSVADGATFYFSLPADCGEGEQHELVEAHLAG
jgi:PAS domain S-box-containing protein